MYNTFIINYDVPCSSLEEQVNKIGLTLGDNVKRLDKLNEARKLCYHSGLITEQENRKALQRLHNMVLFYANENNH